MAEIKGFRGVRYDASRTNGALDTLVAPPYDVISPQEQAALYAKHPKNVVRLILGREDDKYSAAARAFREWLADGTLTADPDPAVYVYRQSFQDPLTGQACPERIGLVCLLKLEEYATGGVLPHENTLTAAKADRLELLRASQAQFESIYGLYSDPDRAVQSFLSEYDDREPVMEAVADAIGSSHAIERINDENAIQTLQNLLRDKQIFIADGHHRYETALNYRRETRAAQSVPEGETIPEDFILITLTAFEDEGLLVLPTHRLVRGVEESKINGLRAALAPEFTVQPLPTAPSSGGGREASSAADARVLEQAIEDQAKAGQVAFGIALPDGVFVATLQQGVGAASGDGAGASASALSRLPVTLLQTRILEQKLGIDASALAAGGQVAYTRDAADALVRVRSGEYQAAFVLGRPAVAEVRGVSLAGDKMPQKSTFFFPKLLSGLLMRDLRLGDDA